MELELELDGLIGGLIPVVLGVYERTLYCRLHGCDFVSFMNTVVLTVLLVRSVVRRLYWRRRVKVG